MKTFVIGDIHGAHKALIQCLERACVDYFQDHLIVLGDVCDGYPQVHLCIKELLKVKHCTYILGNHDLWAMDWGLRGSKPDIWLSQGGGATLDSYDHKAMPPKHIEFLQKGQFWFELDGRLFVHGGFDPNLPIKKQDEEEFVWDRTLIQEAWEMSLAGSGAKLSSYKEIFVGHTPTIRFESKLPLHLCNLWDIDTGAGWGEALTIMDVNTKEFWQSDLTADLYGYKGRR